jgi:hypothetical protein
VRNNRTNGEVDDLGCAMKRTDLFAGNSDWCADSVLNEEEADKQERGSYETGVKFSF